MILAQIEEWFQSGIAGIRAAGGSIAYDKLVFQPKVVGDLTFAEGSYKTPKGMAHSSWKKSASEFSLTVTVPTNTTAEVWVPTGDGQKVSTPRRATYQRAEDGYTVFSVPAGQFTFNAA
ncbi:alpha-L-rhamnosidase C-terminal domain-containing protein [Micromonospora sp. NPDC047738]